MSVGSVIVGIVALLVVLALAVWLWAWMAVGVLAVLRGAVRAVGRLVRWFSAGAENTGAR
jgi:hypothetical protein